MTFTYLGTLATNLDIVRFYIGDTTASSGPKPSGGNFTDEELGGLITAEGSWQKAVAASFETLAGIWQKYADIRMGPRAESLSQIADGYRAQAADWRARFGSSSGSATAAALTRIDGYSDDEASDET